MKNALAFIAIVFAAQLTFGQNPAAYSWFGHSGKTTSWPKVVSACADADIILFGEQHDDAIAHWFQLLLLKELTNRDSTKAALGMEMLERDQQWAVDLFSAGTIDGGKAGRHHENVEQFPHGLPAFGAFCSGASSAGYSDQYSEKICIDGVQKRCYEP